MHIVHLNTQQCYYAANKTSDYGWYDTQRSFLNSRPLLRVLTQHRLASNTKYQAILSRSRYEMSPTQSPSLVALRTRPYQSMILPIIGSGWYHKQGRRWELLPPATAQVWPYCQNNDSGWVPDSRRTWNCFRSLLPFLFLVRRVWGGFGEGVGRVCEMKVFLVRRVWGGFARWKSFWEPLVYMPRHSKKNQLCFGTEMLRFFEPYIARSPHFSKKHIHMNRKSFNDYKLVFVKVNNLVAILFQLADNKL